MTDSTLHPHMDPRDRPLMGSPASRYAARALWDAFTAANRHDVESASQDLADLAGQCCRHIYQLTQWEEVLRTHEKETAFEVSPAAVNEVIGFVAGLGASLSDTREQLQHFGPNLKAGETGERT